MVDKKALVVTALGLVLAAGGCLTRPVLNENPTTSTSVIAEVKQQAIDKVDLLFAIDNSSSMVDKQDLLAAAVPVLVGRLLNPNCVSATLTCAVTSDCASLGAGALCDPTANNGAGQCFITGDNASCKTIPNTHAEFAAVHDMHVGIVSSSLGGGGSPDDVCVVSPGNHNDDQGHLLNRTVGTPEGTIPNAEPTSGEGGNFLAWLPLSDPKNAGKAPPNVKPYGDGQEPELVTDFQSLVSGVQQDGCGLEAQLESWYRFLVQPDPYGSITQTNDNPPKNVLTGVDATLLKMRKDFLRPDSLVAIIQLTDEEDSWSDPMWLGGYGWTNRTESFPGGPGLGAGPRGTTECDTDPTSPDCTSCAFPGNKPVSGNPIAQDPKCTSCADGTTTCPENGWYTPAAPNVAIAGADGLNVRYSQQLMRPKYGFDSQHDIQRYIDGLRSATVPDRNNEPHEASSYAPVRNCTNPVFAGSLPDGTDTSPAALCNLTPGPRTPDLVFYAIIGGVPNELLEDANGNFKSALTSADWTKIVGKDPAHYAFDGIDPHMIESTAPRAGVTGDWNTLTSVAGIDLEYACTFDLPAPKDCTAQANLGACDCSGTAATAPDGPPLCSSKTPTTQIKGKAYPTIRELRVAQGLGEQAIVASLCAKVVSGSTSDPAYGYNGAMQAIVNRLKQVLTVQCLPHPLAVASDGTIPCVVLVQYPTQTNQAAGCTDPGMSQPAANVLARFTQDFQASLGDAGASQPTPVVCAYTQLVKGTDYQGGTCAGSPGSGWCYAEGAPNTGGCAQAIDFGGSGPPTGTVVDLECIENL